MQLFACIFNVLRWWVRVVRTMAINTIPQLHRGASKDTIPSVPQIWRAIGNGKYLCMWSTHNEFLLHEDILYNMMGEQSFKLEASSIIVERDG